MKLLRRILYFLLVFWTGLSVVHFTAYNIESYQWWCIFIPFSIILGAIILTDKQL